MTNTTSLAVRYDRGSPTIVVANESSDVDVPELRRAVAAIQKQVDRDFFPLWGWRAELLFEPDRIPRRATRITINESDEDGDLGITLSTACPAPKCSRDMRKESATAEGKRYCGRKALLRLLFDPVPRSARNGCGSGREPLCARLLHPSHSPLPRMDSVRAVRSCRRQGI
jgi:hypothetical protein